MIAETLRASLGAFDEAALVTLANAGLYRRAARDVADGKVAIVQTSGEAAIVEADGQRVEIDSLGPKAARCSCEARGICRHRIAAVLLLRSAPHDPADEIREEAAFDPIEQLGGIGANSIERWAGKAAWRAALELADAPTTVTVEGDTISVGFATLPEAIRILRGQGLEGIVSKVKGARRKAYHAAAVLAAREHFGLDKPGEAAAQAPAKSALPDPDFLREVEASLADCVAFAFNLAPLPLEERLFALSVSSRADALPRLGRLLRALAAQLRLKRDRSFTFDPDLTLDTLVTAHALARALGGMDVSTSPSRQRLLRGVHRQQFEPEGPLTLVGCGADLWRTDSGARGVTGIFYDPRGDRWLTFAHARGRGQDPTFDPRQTYASSAIWGSATLQYLAGATFVLTGAGVSEEGRLSNPQQAAARIERDVRPDRGDWAARFDDWRALSERLHRRFGLGLARWPSPDFALLVPRRFARPYFDELAQELIWPVEDHAGRWLGLELSHVDGTTQAIDRVEKLGRSGWQGEVVVCATQEGGRVRLAPIAIFDGPLPVSLALEPDKLIERNDRGWGDLWYRFNPLRERGAFRRSPVSATAAALSAAWQCLIDLAEAGPNGARPALLDAIRARAQQLERLGQPVVAGRLQAIVDDSRANFLTAGYALLLACDQRVSIPMLVHHR